jgi:hypothetical protein
MYPFYATLAANYQTNGRDSSFARTAKRLIRFKALHWLRLDIVTSSNRVLAPTRPKTALIFFLLMLVAAVCPTYATWQLG